VARTGDGPIATFRLVVRCSLCQLVKSCRLPVRCVGAGKFRGNHDFALSRSHFLAARYGSPPGAVDRLRRVVDHLVAKGWRTRAAPALREGNAGTAGPCPPARVREEVRSFAERRGGYLDADTVVSPVSYEVACHAAGAVCDAVVRVVHGEEPRALCLVRRRGTTRWPIARWASACSTRRHRSRVATAELGLDRVLIVDWDVHHGNALRTRFGRTSRSLFFRSIVGLFTREREAFTRRGRPGLGTKHNVPITFGTSRLKYLAEFASHLQTFADKVRPQLVLVSAGFDTHRSIRSVPWGWRLRISRR